MVGRVIAEESADPVECTLVGQAHAEELGAVVVDDRVGAFSTPAVIRLGEVLKDREELHSVAGTRRGQDVEVVERCNVGKLVEHDEQTGRQGATALAGL
jgi:hypothetical protein